MAVGLTATMLLLWVACQGMVVTARHLKNPTSTAAAPLKDLQESELDEALEGLPFEAWADGDVSLALPFEGWSEEDIGFQTCITSSGLFPGGLPEGPGPVLEFSGNNPCSSLSFESDPTTLCGTCQSKLEGLANCLQVSNCEDTLSLAQRRFALTVEDLLLTVIDECNQNGYDFVYPLFGCP